MSKMSRLFVTGGAGFIGSHLVDRLIAEGNKVTVYDNLSAGKVDNIKHHFEKESFQFIHADVLDLDALSQSMAGHEVIFHLSANQDLRAGISNTSVDLYQETIATYNVLEAMRHNGIKKLVFSSAATVYGDTPPIPLSEDYGPLLPVSLYGAGKLASEGLISAFCHLFHLQAWIFRLANIVGPRGSHGVIYDFVNKLKRNPHELEILGDGSQEKPYLYVEECVEGMRFGFEHSHDQLNLFNLGVDSSTDVVTVANVIVAEMGLNNVLFRFTGGKRGWPGDAPQVRFNMERIKRLGWQPKLTSDDAVRKAAGEIIQELT